MIDIYNEIGYIKEVIEHGFSGKWERDAKLLIRYYKEYEHRKKSEVKQIIIKKCEEAASQGKIFYKHEVSYKRLNKILNEAWNKDTPLRQIMYIDIPREVVDWFLNLESFQIPSEDLPRISSRNPGISLKKPINWNRTKYLFTLYIWTKVQEAYIPYPNIHALNNYVTRFKEDADLPKNFNMKKERDYLLDLGFLHITRKLHVVVDFIEKYPVFQTPLTSSNTVRIYSGDPGSGDLYHPGYWLLKQKMGSFVCQECGKEFANYSKNEKGGRPRKYCKECADKIQHGKTGEYKTITCLGCGKEVEIDKKDNKTCRCYECQLLQDNIKTRERVQKYRELHDNVPQVTLASVETQNPQTI